MRRHWPTGDAGAVDIRHSVCPAVASHIRQERDRGVLLVVIQEEERRMDFLQHTGRANGVSQSEQIVDTVGKK